MDAIIAALVSDFYPRPPRGGRHEIAAVDAKADAFLSTPSARRATTQPEDTGVIWKISIHALREEGDLENHCSYSLP